MLGAAVLLAAALGALLVSAFVVSSLLESPCLSILDDLESFEDWSRSFEGPLEYDGLSRTWTSGGVLVGTSALEDSPICTRVDPRE